MELRKIELSGEEALALCVSVLEGAIDGLKAYAQLQNIKIDELLQNTKSKAQKNDILKTPIEELNFSIRTYNCLKWANKNTVGDIAKLTEDELMKVRNLGRKSLKEIQEKLAELFSEEKADESQT